jgi:long-chain acyl-CoA synthetase
MTFSASAGFNVYPSEIEDVLTGHPAIEDAAVVGVPDIRHGELVKAYVVVHTDVITPTTDELIDFCARQLTLHKLPYSIEFRPDLPRNILGKVLRRVLRDEATTRVRAADTPPQS